MLEQKHYDVVIIGGGPGGTSAAITLAKAGVSVALCERSHYQEKRVGEMLSPWIRPILTELGQWEHFIQAGHLSSPGIVSCWGSSQLYENEFIFNPYGCGWQIERSSFDLSLALAATEAGTNVFLDTLVIDVNYERGLWNILVRKNGQLSNFKADFLINALGKSQFKKGRLATQRIYLDYLVGIVQFFQHDQNETLDDSRMLIEATEEGWWYSAPLPKGKAIAVMMTDKDFLPVKLTDIQAYWNKSLLTTTYTRARANMWHPSERLHIYNACTSVQSSFSGQQWLAVGDAAATYDPLSAQGILKAIINGIDAAQAIVSSKSSYSISFNDYNASLLSSFNTYTDKRRSYYAQESRWKHHSFWQRRQENHQILTSTI
jgi:flavin-dependent dehydrogenase